MDDSPPDKDSSAPGGATEGAPKSAAADQAGDPAPYYRAHVFCCTNERIAGHPRGCCKDKGAITLRNYMKAKAKDLGLEGVRINASGCLDRCELGPTMVIYPEGVWYACRTKEDIDAVLEQHLVAGGRVSHLMLKPEDGP